MVRENKIADLISKARREEHFQLIWANRQGREHFFINGLRYSTENPLSQPLVKIAMDVWGLIGDDTGREISSTPKGSYEFPPVRWDYYTRSHPEPQILDQKLRWVNWSLNDEGRKSPQLMFRGDLSVRVSPEHADLVNWELIELIEFYKWDISADTITVTDSTRSWTLTVPVIYTDMYGVELDDFQLLGVAPEDTGHSPY